MRGCSFARKSFNGIGGGHMVVVGEEGERGRAFVAGIEINSQKQRRRRRGEKRGRRAREDSRLVSR